MSSSDRSSPIPSGCKVFLSFPDALMVAEIVFGSLVWILVASTDLLSIFQEYQGWLMFVSVTCHIVTTLLLIIYMCGAQNHSSVWITLDAFYHFAATALYLSIAVMQARDTKIYFIGFSHPSTLEKYQLNIAASVFAFIATLLYAVHAIGSMVRWKRSS
ncbi:myelin and lymphocyte protein-like [Hypanus sabinus]|uniref:myelin and lymphocyte protein-like n=1 Tax=Hypanus sabinus TaxID=79690 RepID=UPI0028C4E468|nr:myelin and lymphocyte protein-like [Hypanus sabinus]